MMFDADPIRFVAHVTIECLTPVLVADGSNMSDINQGFVKDVHGLPMIPGTTLAGVLSHGLTDTPEIPKDALRRLVFGFVSNPGEGEAQATGSRLRISDAIFHDASDSPVHQQPGSVTHDEVTLFGLDGVQRDRVRIGPLGAGDGNGKFEMRLCPAGARFTFELELLWGRAIEGETLPEDVEALNALGLTVWMGLLSSLDRAGSRLGQSVRSGFGSFRVERNLQACHWLPEDSDNQPAYASSDFNNYLNVGGSLSNTPDHFVKTATAPAPQETATVLLRDFMADSTFLFGGGIPQDEEDMAPVAEARISWTGTSGNLPGYVTEPQHFLPAAGLKGALRHRTLWHLRRLAMQVGKPVNDNELVPLYGDVKTNMDGKEEGTPGVLFFDDVYLSDVGEARFTHNVIDRFTNGVRAGLLFSERATNGMSGNDISIQLDIGKAPGVSENARAALLAALKDLCAGRLCLGGGSGRGHGAFHACLELDKVAQRWFAGDLTA